MDRCSSKMSIADSFGSGLWTITPCTFGSAFSSSMTARASSGVIVAGRVRSNARIPASAAALFFIRTYIAEAGSSPIRTSTNPGVTPPSASALTRSDTSDRTWAAMAFPSMIFAATGPAYGLEAFSAGSGGGP